MKNPGTVLLLLSLGALVVTTSASKTFTFEICDKEMCDCKEPNKDTAGSLIDSVKAQKAGQNCKCLCGKKEGQTCANSNSHTGDDECEMNLVCIINGGTVATCSKKPWTCKGSFMKLKYDPDTNLPECEPEVFSCATDRLQQGELPKQKAKKQGIVTDFPNQCEMVKENRKIWEQNKDAPRWLPIA